MVKGFPIRMALDLLGPHSKIRRSLAGSQFPHDKQRIYSRNLEIPSGGGVGTARAIARAYSVFATDGKELGLTEKTLQELIAPATAPTHGFFDEVLKGEVQFSLGFMKASPAFPFVSPGSFGHPGAGGSIGFADSGAQIGYGYVPNRKSVAFSGDPRDVALRRALYSVIGN
jgi:CubicO group peptidase (beta-lactamase class C family)